MFLPLVVLALVWNVGAWGTIAVWSSRKRDKLGIPRSIDPADRVIGAARTGLLQATFPLAILHVSPELLAIAGRWRYLPLPPVAFRREDTARVDIVQGALGTRVTITPNGGDRAKAWFAGNGPQVAQLLRRFGWGDVTVF